MDWLGNTTNFDYDADSNLVARRLPAGTGAADEFEYDEAGRLTALTFDGAAGPDGSLALTRYGAGQVTGSDWQGLPGDSQAYGYDAIGRDVAPDLSTPLTWHRRRRHPHIAHRRLSRSDRAADAGGDLPAAYHESARMPGPTCTAWRLSARPVG